MAAVLKTARGASSSWVRIPHPPLSDQHFPRSTASFADLHDQFAGCRPSSRHRSKPASDEGSRRIRGEIFEGIRSAHRPHPARSPGRPGPRRGRPRSYAAPSDPGPRCTSHRSAAAPPRCDRPTRPPKSPERRRSARSRPLRGAGRTDERPTVVDDSPPPGVAAPCPPPPSMADDAAAPPAADTALPLRSHRGSAGLPPSQGSAQSDRAVEVDAVVIQPGQRLGAAESLHEHREHCVTEHAAQAGGGLAAVDLLGAGVHLAQAPLT
jgi:hypothetical protein